MCKIIWFGVYAMGACVCNAPSPHFFKIMCCSPNQSWLDMGAKWPGGMRFSLTYIAQTDWHKYTPPPPPHCPCPPLEVGGTGEESTHNNQRAKVSSLGCAWNKRHKQVAMMSRKIGIPWQGLQHKAKRFHITNCYTSVVRCSSRHLKRWGAGIKHDDYED